MKVIKIIVVGLFIIIPTLEMYAQCNIKTTLRPDGHTMKYFNPSPTIRLDTYEVGVSIYKNIDTEKYYVSVAVLFKKLLQKKITGKLIIQTTGVEGLSLDLYTSEEITMNNNRLSVALYEINQPYLKELKDNRLKSLYFSLNGELYGSTVTENKAILSNQIHCLN